MTRSDDVPVQGHPSPYGQPAVALLARQVVEIKDGDPLAPVTVVVASNYVAVAARRALAARPGGIANLSVLTLYRLAERLGATTLAAAGRRPVSAPVIAAAVRGVLDDEPGVFAPVADHPATERALVAAHRELAAVPDDTLDLVAACSPRAQDVVRIHRAVRGRLSRDWYGEHDLLVAAAEAWSGRTTVGSDPVIVHLLQEIPPAGAQLLRLLRPVYVNVGITGDADADGPVLASHRRAGVEVVPPDMEPPCAASIVSASDPDDEVRAAVRLVTRWAYEGINLGRVALVYGMADPYARLLHEQLTAAGIAWNGTPVREVGDLLFGRTLRALLALPDRGYRRPDVLGVLTSAPLLDGDRRVPGRAWERLSREAGVAGGDDWDERLANLATHHRHQAEAIEAQGEEDGLAERRHRDAETAEALACFVGRLRADLDGGAAAGSWAASVEWAQRLIVTYLGDERRRVRWPEEERLAAERVEAALDRLAGLDALEGSTPTVEVFRRALEVDEDLGAVPAPEEAAPGASVGFVAGAVGIGHEEEPGLVGRGPTIQRVPGADGVAHELVQDLVDQASLVKGADHEEPLGLLHRLDPEHVLQQVAVRAPRPGLQPGGRHPPRWADLGGDVGQVAVEAGEVVAATGPNDLEGGHEPAVGDEGGMVVCPPSDGGQAQLLFRCRARGYIDLLFRDDAGLMVVDYKTDAWSTESDLAAKVERYSVQLQAYADAVRAAVGEPVASGCLLFLGASATRTVYVDTLALMSG